MDPCTSPELAADPPRGWASDARSSLLEGLSWPLPGRTFGRCFCCGSRVAPGCMSASLMLWLSVSVSSGSLVLSACCLARLSLFSALTPQWPLSNWSRRSQSCVNCSSVLLVARARVASVSLGLEMEHRCFLPAAAPVTACARTPPLGVGLTWCACLTDLVSCRLVL